MTELGATDDPRVLIPGDPAAIHDNVTAIRGRGDTMTRVGDGLRRIDTGDAWTGKAADAFRDVFTQQPGRWLTAGDAFTVAAGALSRYVDTLSWAQSQAAEAIHVWNEAQARSAAARSAHDPDAGHLDDPGDDGRAQARAILDNAHRQVRDAGDDAARTIRAATADAPTQPSLWANIADWRHELDRGVREAGQDLIDLAQRVDPGRLLTDPTGVADDVASAATGLVATQPADIGAAISRGIADDLHTWTTNPARALGHDLPDIALGAVTGGSSFLGKHAAEGALEAAGHRLDEAAESVAAAQSRESVDRKLNDYLLDPDHPSGGSKARWFEQALGFNRQNAQLLADQMVFDPRSAVEGTTNQYGTKYEQVLPIHGVNGRTIDVNTVWIRNNDGIVRLVTAIPTSKR